MLSFLKQEMNKTADENINIEMSYDSFDDLMEIFDRMDFKAGETVPEMESIKKEILPNLDVFMPFLLWIDETGTETEENKEIRKYINKIIKERLVLIDE